MSKEERKPFKTRDPKIEKDPKTKRSFKDKDDRKDFRDVKFPKRNDPAFYTKYKVISDNAASIAFNHRNGDEVEYRYGSTTVSKNIDPLMVIQYVPTVGQAHAKSSAVNVTADATYKVLNRKYRGSMGSVYEAADVGIIQFAVSDYFFSLAQAERVYGMCQLVNLNQQQYPREMVIAAGYDYDSISRRLADFRASLNNLILRSKQLCLIKGYSLLDHHLFLLSNIFKDKNTARANFFMYTKPGYWKWNPNGFKTGSALVWQENVATHFWRSSSSGGYYHPLLTADDIISNLTNQLEALLNDTDVDKVCADILAYFGNDGTDNANIVYLSMMPEEYMVQPLFDENALKQLHNTMVPYNVVERSTRTTESVNDIYFTAYPDAILNTGDTQKDKGLCIFQQNGIIKFNANVCYKTGSTIVTLAGGDNVRALAGADYSDLAYEKPIIDTDILSPTPDEVIEMTRQTTITEHINGSTGGTAYDYLAFRTFSTFLPVSMRVYEFLYPGSKTVDTAGDLVLDSSVLLFSDIKTADNNDGNVPVLARFDWAPIVHCRTSKRLFGDLDNYIEINSALLRPIHNIATLSELTNPVAAMLIEDKVAK